MKMLNSLEYTLKYYRKLSRGGKYNTIINNLGTYLYMWKNVYTVIKRKCSKYQI